MGTESGGFKWSRFFAGLANPLNFAKSFVFLVQMSIIILLVLSVAFAGVAIKRKLIAPKKDAQPVTINTQSGPVHNSTDQIRKKFGIINLW